MEEETNKEAKTVGWKRRILRWLLMAAVLSVVAIAAFVLSIPYLLTHVPIPELEFDLSPHVKGRLAEIARSKTATVDLDIKRGKPDGFRVRAKGMLLDWPYTATANVRFGFVRADGDLTLSIDGTDWRLYADFSAQGAKAWRFNANIAERPVSQDDRLLADVISRLALSSICATRIFFSISSMFRFSLSIQVYSGAMGSRRSEISHFLPLSPLSIRYPMLNSEAPNTIT